MIRIVILLLTMGPAVAQARQDVPPNIVLIIGDDHGYPYFGFTGSRHVHTPNMDTLAAAGAVFHLGHTTSNHCRPALQSLMTGQVPIRYDFLARALHARASAASPAYQAATDADRRQWDVQFHSHVMRDFVTLPRMLAKRGYVSFQGGKWWEQSYENGGFTEGMSTGWDAERWGRPGWFADFMGGEGLALTRETQQPVYDFIDRHLSRPFFLWYAPLLPHTPFDAPQIYTRRYADTSLSQTAKAYYSNCTWFDDGVGDLVAYIAGKGLLARTLFVYVNDNGWEQEPFAEYAGNAELEANGGPRGKKSLHDLAFRTPIVLHWSGRITPAVFPDELVSTLDIVPTILDYAGVPAPEGLPGHSLRPVVEGNTAALRTALIGHVTGLRSPHDVMGRNAEGFYVRTRRWHFIWYKDDGRVALYDMVQDPKADHDVADGHPRQVTEFLQMIEQWRTEALSATESSARNNMRNQR